MMKNNNNKIFLNNKDHSLYKSKIKYWFKKQKITFEVLINNGKTGNTNHDPIVFINQKTMTITTKTMMMKMTI